MGFAELKQDLERLGIRKSKRLNPIMMTDTEIARLRFTTVSDEESEIVTIELERRAKMLEIERLKFNDELEAMPYRNIYLED